MNKYLLSVCPTQLVLMHSFDNCGSIRSAYIRYISPSVIPSVIKFVQLAKAVTYEMYLNQTKLNSSIRSTTQKEVRLPKYNWLKYAYGYQVPIKNSDACCVMLYNVIDLWITWSRKPG